MFMIALDWWLGGDVEDLELVRSCRGTESVGCCEECSFEVVGMGEVS